MHHTNADSPSAGLPLRGASSTPPPRFPRGAPGEAADAPAGQRARAPAGRMPPAASSGYEQILAARAAMRRGMERTIVADPRDLAGPPPAPFAGKAGQPPLRRAQPRRRKGLVLCCVMAPPVSALLALALVGPQRSPSARLAEPAAPAAAWAIPQPRLAVAAVAAPAPTAAEADGPVFAVQRSGGAPRGDGPPDPGPEGVEPALVAWGPAAPSPALDAGPTAKPSGLDAPPPVLELRAGAEEESAADGFAVAAGADTPAAGDDGTAGANAAGSAATREPPPAEAPPAAPRFAVPAAVPPLPPWVRAEPSPGGGVPAARPTATAVPAPAPVAPKAAAAAAVPAPAAPAVPDGLPPLPPWVRAAPEATRTGESPPPARAAEGGGSPAVEARCRAIVVKLQLGEDMSHAERAFLQTSCGARRR